MQNKAVRAIEHGASRSQYHVIDSIVSIHVQNLETNK
jgi:hypothetical protein